MSTKPDGKLYAWINTFDTTDTPSDQIVDIIFNDKVYQMPLDFIIAMNDKFDDLRQQVHRAVIERDIELESRIGPW